METNISHSIELNLDGIIGPTHNYGGLSYGNIASMEHFRMSSNPKEAAKQGLAKMKTLFDLGIKQAVIPPQERPFFPLFYSLGYSGTEEEVLKQVFKNDPSLLLTGYSSSSMWTANAATISPSADTRDHTVHFTPANLISKLHRSIETHFTAFILRKIFSNPAFFTHHHPLPPHANFADEGAANHTRLSSAYDQPGIELFVYGCSSVNNNAPTPLRFPARQTYEASQTIARLHQLDPNRVVFAQQNPIAIDSGIFHNDVISVGNQNVFLYHEDAFINTPQIIQTLCDQFASITETPLHCICVNSDSVPLSEAVKTYLFNSQIITLPNRTMALIVPMQCYDSPQVKAYLDGLVKETSHPIKQVIYQDINQSMQNGGGPACLRLRVPLNEKEYEQVYAPVLLTETLYDRLLAWIDHNYRDRLELSDLTDPSLIYESRIALDELTRILRLGPIYHFQQH